MELKETNAGTEDPNKSHTSSDEAAEMDSARMDGLELLDDLILTFHSQVKKKLDKHFRTGDLIRMIELRYKLSPTKSEEQEFWKMLAKIRRDTLKNSAGNEKLKENEDKQKSSSGLVRKNE